MMLGVNSLHLTVTALGSKHGTFVCTSANSAEWKKLDSLVKVWIYGTIPTLTAANRTQEERVREGCLEEP